MMLKTPFLLYLGDIAEVTYAKTASGIAYWRPELAKGQMRFGASPADLGLPDTSFAEAVGAGIQTLVIGVASAGGVLPTHWIPHLKQALEAGLDVANGLHTRLEDIPELRDAARASGRQLHDVRFPTQEFCVGTGDPRPGRRLLTVGTDCAVGKMYTSLALHREMTSRGIETDFRATGQTGILIAGSGVSVDAVVADFVSGAAEWLSPANAPQHWDVIEGQGSLFHPSYASVSMGLLHGSQPDTFVVCHEAGRRHMHMDTHTRFPIPSLTDCIALNQEVGALTSPEIRCLGVSINTSSLSDSKARDFLARTEYEIQLPCVDPVRTGVDKLVDRLESEAWPVA